jgi:hypothetical protein
MKTFSIHGDDWDEDYIRFMLRDMRDGEFQRARWAPRDALVLKDGSRATIYTGQEYDPEKMILRRNFWDHDHCQVCNWLFIGSEGEDHVLGYTNGYNWLCDECHRLFIQEDQLNRKK